MSHFTVLVIGSDPEAQLAPFHEFECTGIDDQYVQDIDITADVAEKGLDYYGLDDCVISSLDELDLSNDHKYGYAIIQNGELIKAVNRTNPNSKWDWYQLGGRWGGFFTLRNGKKTDQCKKAEIDFEKMRSTRGNKAASDYDRLHKIVAGREIPSWDEIREKHPEDIDAARKEYHDNQVIKDINADEYFRDMFIWNSTPFEFAESRADFIQKARNSAISTYAFIRESQWFARGEMGWFGMSHDEIDEDDWNKQFNEMLDQLPDDTLLSVWDCHI